MTRSAYALKCSSLLVMVLAGCESSTDLTSKLSINVPVSRDDAQRSFSDYEGAALEISINGGAVQNFPKQSSDTWSVIVSGVILHQLNDIELLWNVTVDGQRYDVARQTDTFLADPDAGPFSVDAQYIDQIFDHDNDTVSNLAEINAGGFPVPDDAIPELVTITAPGCFTLGSPVAEHGPLGYTTEQQVQTCIVEDYAMGKYEVTYAQYDLFANAVDTQNLPSDNSWGRGNLPVTNITWNDANNYVEWLSAISGQSFRLPTEAEWEYAARANTETAYNTGATIHTGQGNFFDRSNAEATSVFYNVTATDGAVSVGGVFRLVDTALWEERELVLATGVETRRFTFTELRRDDQGIHLYDNDRALSVRLSLDSGQVYADNQTDPALTATSLLYTIADSPEPVGLRTLAVGSFASNGFGLHDMHGNVFEWTCSILQSVYGGAESQCEKSVPDNARMIKRSGSWKSTLRDIRSANRGWNNDFGVSDAETGVRVVLDLSQ